MGVLGYRVRLSGEANHAGTRHPAGCAVALENIAIMEEEQLVERSQQMGEQL